MLQHTVCSEAHLQQNSCPPRRYVRQRTDSGIHRGYSIDIVSSTSTDGGLLRRRRLRMDSIMIAPPPFPALRPRLLDCGLDFVAIVAANGLVQSVSAAIKPLGGYDPQDLVGRQYQSIIHSDDRARAAKLLARALQGTPSEPVTLRYRRKDGSWRTILASAQNLLEDPAIRGLAILTRDVTEQCAAESLLAQANSRVVELTEELSKAEERQRMYIASELHDDVQQILVGLRMSMAPSRRVLTGCVPTESVEDWTALLQKAIDHLHELTLVLRMPATSDRSLPEVLRAHVDRVRVDPTQKIAFETDENVGTVAPNVALACFRIVQEGVANAVKHSRATNLQVGLKRVNDNVMVSVIDDGAGFDVNDALARAAKVGSVGLSSMRERAIWAGGRLEIESTAGAGTQIVASFPAERLHGQPRAAH
jgi:PAS domain S-box-containing protein